MPRAQQIVRSQVSVANAQRRYPRPALSVTQTTTAASAGLFAATCSLFTLWADQPVFWSLTSTSVKTAAAGASADRVYHPGGILKEWPVANTRKVWFVKASSSNATVHVCGWNDDPNLL